MKKIETSEPIKITLKGQLLTSVSHLALKVGQ